MRHLDIAALSPHLPGMDELTPFDHALRGIVAIGQPVDPGQKGVAIGDTAADTRCLRLG